MADDALTAAVAEALAAHREDGLTCYDHPTTSNEPRWCCPCGEHSLRVLWRVHVAERVAQVVREHTAAEHNGCAGCGTPVPEDRTGWRFTDAEWCPKCGWLA